MLLATNILHKNTDLVIQGIERLLSFEVKGGGFSLFGRAPANPSLTAYGILEFYEIVDYLTKRGDTPDLLKLSQDALYRAETWLLSDEAIQSNWCQKTVMDWIGRSSCNTTTAYIHYALSHRSMPLTIGNHIMELFEKIIQSPQKYSTYIIALEGLTLSNLHEEQKAKQISKILLKRQSKDGSFHNGKETITSRKLLLFYHIRSHS